MANRTPRYNPSVHEKAFRLWMKYGSFSAVAKLPGMPSIETLKRWASPTFPCNCGWHDWENLKLKIKSKQAELLVGKQAPTPEAVDILHQVREVLCPECRVKFDTIVTEERLKALSSESIQRAQELETKLETLAAEEIKKLDITRVLKQQIKQIVDSGYLKPKTFRELVEALDRIDKIEARIMSSSVSQGTTIPISQHKMILATFIDVVVDAIKSRIDDESVIAGIADDINRLIQSHALMSKYKIRELPGRE